MNEELEKILNKFDIVLRNYEFDKKFGQMSVDSICHLFPSEILIIKNYIKTYENMRKEAIEYAKNSIDLLKPPCVSTINEEEYAPYIIIHDNYLNILNKVGGSDE